MSPRGSRRLYSSQNLPLKSLTCFESIQTRPINPRLCLLYSYLFPTFQNFGKGQRQRYFFQRLLYFISEYIPLISLFQMFMWSPYLAPIVQNPILTWSFSVESPLFYQTYVPPLKKYIHCYPVGLLNIEIYEAIRLGVLIDMYASHWQYIAFFVSHTI